MKKHYSLIFLFIFVAFSLYAIVASDPLISISNYPLEHFYLQTQWFTVGFLAIYCISKINLEVLWALLKVFYIVMLIGVYLLSISHQLTMHDITSISIPYATLVNGSTAWFTFPKIGTIQPSEFLKIGHIALVALTIEKFETKHPEKNLKNSLLISGKILLMSLPACLGVLLQNDLGVTLIILFATFAMLLASQFSWLILTPFLVVFGAAGSLLLVKADWLMEHFASYRFGRIMGWLHPEEYYSTYGYQLVNAKLAYQSAGFYGNGFQSVIMPLPEAHTDFIFAVLLSNAGAIFGIILVMSIALFDIYLLLLAKKQVLRRYRYLLCGLVGSLFFQQFWNIAMVLGLMPITGITLPFISYGGSSLLSYMILMGVVYQIEAKNG